MSPEKAKILLIEDTKEKETIIMNALRGSGHHIVEVIRNRMDAKRRAQTIGHEAVQVVLLDGNLGYRPGVEDGEEIAADIRQSDPDIGIINTYNFRRNEQADVKIVNNLDKLPEIIDKL